MIINKLINENDIIITLITIIKKWLIIKIIKIKGLSLAALVLGYHRLY